MKLRIGTITAFAISVIPFLNAGAQARSPIPNQGPADPAIPRSSASTPPSGDTLGYWQQRADYTVVAKLDDTKGIIDSKATLVYVNNSPDVLNELWFHLHLNAFRPGSRWSETDEREGRVRFQNLSADEIAYERFKRAPMVNGKTLRLDWPLSPDSTVVRARLNEPLASGDSISVVLEWTARPSTVSRRQGRRGRSVDFAQWYPKVAVYDRHGWKPNAFVPAGELYGEFGTIDATFIVAEDQILGSTGVPVEGDPGWQRVAAPGQSVDLRANAYGTISAGPKVDVPAGFRAVRFLAKDVHHFGWSASPGFRYEGGRHIRSVPVGSYRFPVWDTVAVHVLYRADAEEDCELVASSSAQDQRERVLNSCISSSLTQWEKGRALAFGLRSLEWLESVFGHYSYPQMTILKRIDPGGTEFPMMMQNGSASQGLVTHEAGHIYAYGILGSNEWQSGWMDEGLTSYQSSWQNSLVRPVLSAQLAALNPRDPSNSTDSLLNLRIKATRSASLNRNRAVTEGRAEPIGTRGDLFKEFSSYNGMVYGKAAAMYEALHDAVGDKTFRAFLTDYYSRWGFRHVDRWAMQSSVERVTGTTFEWFFDQWVDNVGIVDYALSDPRVEQVSDGWRTTVTLSNRGSYRHPMPVGVRTAAGWTVLRGDPLKDTVQLVFTTRLKPDAVWLDPFMSTDASSLEDFRITID